MQYHIEVVHIVFYVIHSQVWYNVDEPLGRILYSGLILDWWFYMCSYCFGSHQTKYTITKVNLHLPRLLHSPDCLKDSTLYTYTDLGSGGYFGIWRRCC